MKKIFIIYVVLTIFSLQLAAAQYVLTGNVCDEKNNGVFSATVRVLLTADSTFVGGTTTDDKGVFSFKKLKGGNYILAVSNIGYVSQYVNIDMPQKDYVLPLVTLKADNVLLDEVVVEGSSFIRKKDHLLVIPDKEQNKHAYTGYDLLYNLMIPGVNVNRRENTVVTGRGVATLYINGVEANFREIQNLRPKDIERIEYYAIPSGRYVGDMASINYVTKEYKAGGYISIDGEQNVGYLAGKYNAAAKVVHGNTSYTFFGGYNMKEYDGIEKTQNEVITFSDNEVNRDKVNNGGKYSNNQQYAQLKIGNNNKKRDLSGMVSFVRNDMPHNDRDELLNYSGVNVRQISSSDFSNQNSLKPSLHLNGVFRPKENQELSFKLNGAYIQNTYNRIYKESEQLSSTHADEDLYSFDVRAFYDIQMKNKNTFTTQFVHYHNVTSSTYSGDYDSWQHLWMGESMLYLNYMQEFNNGIVVNIYPGVSLLNYRLHNEKVKRFWSFRTNTWLMYRFNSEHWVGAGFAAGNNQASLNYLNNMDQTVDFLQIKRGNSNLDNTKIYDFFLSYEGQLKPVNLQLNIWYSIYDDNITSHYYIENNKLISSYRSTSSYYLFKTELQASSRFSKKLRLNAKLKYEYMNVSDESELNRHNYMAAIDINYFLKSFTINAYAQTSERKLNETTLAFLKAPGNYGLSVRYNGKNWMAEVGAENLFTKHCHYREYADYGVYWYNQIRTSRIYQQTGYIKLAYTFDFGKKTSRESNSVDRSINSAILKAE